MFNKAKSLTDSQRDIIQRGKTERCFSSSFHIPANKSGGSFLCRQCGIKLFLTTMHFKSNCGWPSFDDAYQKNVKFKPDPDKHRTEIICANCNGHLGHLFLGEGYTEKNRRFCVNSTAIEFVKSSSVENTEEIILAGGCFWGIEASFQKQPGVLKTEVGYTGGKTTAPTYETVSTGETGHLEAVRIVYDPSVVTLKDLYQLFFEIHDFEHEKSKAVNVGNQYLSCIFYYNQTQKEIANAVVSQLKSNNYQVATTLKPIRTFWSAESYHQSYYQKNFRQSWCQTKKNIFRS